MEEVGALQARVPSCSSGQVVALPEAANTPWVNWLLRQDPASSLLQLRSEARTTAQQRCQGQATPVSRACCTPKPISCCQGGYIHPKNSAAAIILQLPSCSMVLHLPQCASGDHLPQRPAPDFRPPQAQGTGCPPPSSVQCCSALGCAWQMLPGGHSWGRPGSGCSSAEAAHSPHRS